MLQKPIKKVGHYSLMEIIGKGNYSEVYSTIDTKNNQILAIKCISKSKFGKKHQQVNLKRELEILHKMKHPNIIGLKNYINNPKNYYIVLEFCNGCNLEEYLKKYISEYKHPLNELFIQKIMQQIAPAMEYMHLNNIIHRDIKSQNILINFDNYLNVTKNGQLPTKLTFREMSLNKPFTIKIEDLGFAKDLLKDSEGSTVLGTPMYMSPDIVMNYIDSDKKKYNTSVDLWSLGVITYELLTGSTPFLGRSRKELFNNIAKGIYSLPKNLKASIEIIIIQKKGLIGNRLIHIHF
jgi:serine/threonine protein kinase